VEIVFFPTFGREIRNHGMEEKILVIGSAGQIGTELVEALRIRFGFSNVVASDLKAPLLPGDGPFEVLDVTDAKAIADVVKKYEITQIYLLAALEYGRPSECP
jgi:nucleoside-diphosphate-sugar epimerase